MRDVILQYRSTNAGGANDPYAIRGRLLDYAKVGQDLFFQRIVIYSAAMVLAGAYYSWVIAFAFYAFVLVCELYDTYVFRKIIGRQVWEQVDVRRAMIGVYVGTILSSAAISLFAISFAMQQSPESGHFMPVFMLVSASIFAAMNNHHFLHILVTRLLIYVSAIIAIPVYDVWFTSAPISSEVWLHLFTVLFVLGFLFELARNFLAGYSKSLQSRLDLEREHEQTKAAYKAKTEFLSTVSHELRTPLTSIKGPLALINSGALGEVPEKMRLPLEIAGRNAKRLETLVEDLLLLQRADAGKLDLNFEITDIGSLVLEAVERFQSYAVAMKVKIQLDAVPQEFWVRCDVKRIDHVVTNLLSNAAKFSDDSNEIFVSITQREGKVRVSVRDEGIGIADGDYEKIFDAFGQVDSSDTRKFQGSGLGLNISKRIIDAHEGNLDYVSTLGQGSTFFFELEKWHCQKKLA